MSQLRARATDLRSRLYLTLLRRRALRALQIRRMRQMEDDEVGRLGTSTSHLPDARVAVIIPTHGRDRLVGEAVRSALAQTVDDLVVIVVADGPPAPSTLPADGRLVLVTLSQNIGVVGVVRNVGIRLSRAPIIAFLDDDNTWAPEHLESLLPALDRGADVAYSGVDRVLPDGRQFDELFEPFDRTQLCNRNYVDTNSIILRRSKGARFSRVPIRPGESPGEDWELAWRLSRSQSVVGVPRSTVRYLINPQSYFWHDFSSEAEQVLDSRNESTDDAERH